MSSERTRDFGRYVAAADDDVIICRCEEVAKGEIRRAVRDGLFTVHEVRRLLRCGMGLCQGNTCARLVRGIIARELGVAADSLVEATGRAPARPLEMRVFAREQGL
ncbi:MAG: (2Fe-2S)-binding protein [Gracilibacteraceae bacterium]|jgi:NAD(P)H-nitrite reductase large subunit|nr:(2Fe-2S)-binding protein [Gracilibacteraceae bacterium]